MKNTQVTEELRKNPKSKNRSGKRAKKKERKNQLEKVIANTTKEEREKTRVIAREKAEKKAKEHKQQKEEQKKLLKENTTKLLDEVVPIEEFGAKEELEEVSKNIDHPKDESTTSDEMPLPILENNQSNAHNEQVKEVDSDYTCIELSQEDIKELNEIIELEQNTRASKQKRFKMIVIGLLIIGTIVGSVIGYQIMKPGWKESEEGIRYKTSYKKEFVTGINEIEEELYIFDAESYLEYGWIEYEGNTYYANEFGVLAKGHVQIDDKFYNFDEDEAMFLVGWVEKDNNTYYYQEDSTKTLGIYEIEEALYYFEEENGIQQIGHYKVEEKMYLFIQDGIKPGIYEYEGNSYMAMADYTLKTGLYKYENAIYYLSSETGEMLTQWHTINDKKYYFSTDDYKGVAGWQTINDKKYHFHADGYVSNGIITVSDKKYYFVEGIAKSGWQTIGGNKYYFISGGGTYSGAQTIDGKSYYFKSEGYLAEGWTTISGKTYYFLNNQKVTTTTKIGGETYYFNNDGTVTTGWVTSGSNKYYYNKYGMKLTGWQTISSKKYYFNSDGVMATSTSLDGYNISSSGVATLAPVTSSTLNTALDKLLSKYGRSLSGAASAAKSSLSYKRMSSSGGTVANAVYAINNGRGACYHYASLTYELFKRLGYSPTYIVGVGRNAPNAHAWVSVTVNGSVRYYDSLYSTNYYTAEQLKAYGYSW